MNVFSHSLNMKKLNFYSKISTQNGLSKWMLKWTRSYHIAFFQHTGRNCSPSPWKHPIWTPLVDTHIIHKPPHHQERPPASPVGHRPYNNRLSSTGHQKKRPEGPFSPYAPFPNHRSSLRNGRYHCRSRAVAPHRSIPNRSDGDRQPYMVCMDIVSVHFEWNTWESFSSV